MENLLKVHRIRWRSPASVEDIAEVNDIMVFTGALDKVCVIKILEKKLRQQIKKLSSSNWYVSIIAVSIQDKRVTNGNAECTVTVHN